MAQSTSGPAPQKTGDARPSRTSPLLAAPPPTPAGGPPPWRGPPSSGYASRRLDRCTRRAARAAYLELRRGSAWPTLTATEDNVHRRRSPVSAGEALAEGRRGSPEDDDPVPASLPRE
ncbi:hypothetical protein KM043_015823 [Ampulex compressa]|nr:hypothetical protein KM043_015823 [Ampulex compressa]